MGNNAQLAAICAMFAVGVAGAIGSPPNALAASKSLSKSLTMSCRQAARAPRDPNDASIGVNDCATLEAKFDRQWTRLETLRSDAELCGLTPNQVSRLSWAVLAIDQNLQRRCGATTRLIRREQTGEARVATELSQTGELLEHYASGYTRLRLDPAHGAQVEYNAPDGRTYLWYPGERQVTPGFWRASEVMAPDGVHHPSQMCYLYGRNSIDPATGSPGGRWDCTMGWLFVLNTWDRQAGDIFGLAQSSTTPFELGGEPQSLAELKRQESRMHRRSRAHAQ